MPRRQSLGFSVFPFLGGHLLEQAGLRAVFGFSTGLVVLMLLLAWLLLDEPDATRRHDQ